MTQPDADMLLDFAAKSLRGASANVDALAESMNSQIGGTPQAQVIELTRIQVELGEALIKLAHARRWDESSKGAER